MSDGPLGDRDGGVTGCVECRGVVEMRLEHDQRRAGLAARVATGAGETVDQHDVLVGMTSGAEDWKPGVEIFAQDRVLRRPSSDEPLTARGQSRTESAKPGSAATQRGFS
jgi:hypothetical protein